MTCLEASTIRLRVVKTASQGGCFAYDRYMKTFEGLPGAEVPLGAVPDSEGEGGDEFAVVVSGMEDSVPQVAEVLSEFAPEEQAALNAALNYEGKDLRSLRGLEDDDVPHAVKLLRDWKGVEDEGAREQLVVALTDLLDI